LILVQAAEEFHNVAVATTFQCGRDDGYLINDRRRSIIISVTVSSSSSSRRSSSMETAVT